MAGLAALLWLPPPVDAQAALELEATPGFEGHLRLGSWAPVRVVVTNRGAAAQGVLSLPRQNATGDREYRLAVQIPPSSRRAFTLYLRYQQATDIGVRLALQAGRVLRTDAVCHPHETGSRLVLVVSRRAGGLSFLGAVPLTPGPGDEGAAGRDAVVAYVSPDARTGDLTLPDHPAGYDTVSAVVLRDISPSSFLPDEQEALARWVAGGGLLVIVAGPNVAELRDSFIEQLSPVLVRGQKTLRHLEALARWTDATVSLQQARVADGEAKPEAEVLVQQDGTPLVARKRYENGAVYFLAADSSAPPLEHEDALLLRLWGEILQDADRVDAWPPMAWLRSPDAEGIPPQVVRLPAVEWDAFAAFGGFLLAYAAILFIVAHVVLRRTDRREWSGHVMLLLIAGFSLGALYMGRSVKLAFRRTYEAGVAVTRCGSSVAWTEGIVGVRSPNRQRATFDSGGTGRTLEMAWAGRHVTGWPVDEEAGLAIRGLPIDLWGFAAMRVAGPIDLGGPINAQFVALAEDRAAIVVDNQTPCDLQYPFILTPGTAHPVEAIPARRRQQVGAIPLDELRGVPQQQMQAISEVLLEHCEADEGATAPEQRVRRRVLRLFDNEEFRGLAPGGGMGASTPAMPGVPLPPMSAMLPARPMLGAWVSLPTSLVQMEPASDAHLSQVLLMVEIPVDVSILDGRGIAFRPLEPGIGSASGVWRDYAGKLSAEPGCHELTFQLPRSTVSRRAVRLEIQIGCDSQGFGAEVYNVRKGRWEPLAVEAMRTRRTSLVDPDDYVRWPQAVVRTRVTYSGDGQVNFTCMLTGDLSPPLPAQGG